MLDLTGVPRNRSEIEDLLREILTELRAIHKALEPARLTHQDHLTLAKLLPAIVGDRGSDCFTAKELLRNAVMRKLTGGMNSNQLGLLLSRATGEDIALLTVENVKLEHSAALWRVVSILP